MAPRFDQIRAAARDPRAKIAEGAAPDFRGSRLIEFVEARRDACLQRKPPEDAAAERVDRLDPEAARRLQRMRE